MLYVCRTTGAAIPADEIELHTVHFLRMQRCLHGCGTSQCLTHVYFVYKHTHSSVSVLHQWNKCLNNCWIVFQILMNLSTKSDSPVFVNISQGLLHLNFARKCPVIFRLLSAKYTILLSVITSLFKPFLKHYNFLSSWTFSALRFHLKLCMHHNNIVGLIKPFHAKHCASQLCI